MSGFKSLDIHIDGSSFGNPGEAGIGVIFSEGKNTIRNISQYIGRQTNNVAEYTALIFALQEALVLKVKNIIVYSDSELLCRQLSGAYKVKNEQLKVLFLQAKTLLGGFENVRIQQIPREENAGADKLARQAVKTKISKIDGIATLVSYAGEESPGSKGQRSGQ